MKTKLFATAIISLFCTSAINAAPTKPEQRLIQFGPAANQIAWMSDAQTDALSLRAHEAGHCGGYFDITDHPEKRTRGDLPVVIPPSLMSSMAVGPQFPEIVEPLIPELSASNMNDTVAALSAFHNRYYRSPEGVAAATWIRDQFAAYGAGRDDITIGFMEHRFAQPSVIARIAGVGPNANETIIIGGHEDSIHQTFFGGDNGKAPGADDNASGVATILEIYRVLAQSGYRPSRTLEFMTYAGEEKGLLGSQDIAEFYRDHGRLVAGVMQFDMTMFPGESHKITFITDHVNANLTRFTQMLVDRYVGFAWTTSQCGYACSDHASWTSAGYASVFPFEAPEEEMNHDIHTERDVIGKLSADFGLQFAKTGLAFAVEMSAGQ